MPASSQASSELSTASLTAVRRAFLGLSKPSRCLFFAKNSLTDISRCFAAIDSAVTARRFGCSPISLTFGIFVCSSIFWRTLLCYSPRPQLKARANTENEPAVFNSPQALSLGQTPLGTCSQIMLFWSRVDFTSDCLLFNVLWIELARGSSQPTFVTVLLAEINSEKSRIRTRSIMVAQLCDHFEQLELARDNTWRSHATKTYRAYWNRWVRPLKAI